MERNAEHADLRFTKTDQFVFQAGGSSTRYPGYVTDEYEQKKVILKAERTGFITTITPRTTMCIGNTAMDIYTSFRTGARYLLIGSYW